MIRVTTTLLLCLLLAGCLGRDLGCLADEAAGNHGTCQMKPVHLP